MESQVEAVSPDGKTITMGGIKFGIVPSWHKRILEWKAPIAPGDWLDYDHDDSMVITSLRRLIGPSDRKFTSASELPRQAPTTPPPSTPQVTAPPPPTHTMAVNQPAQQAREAPASPAQAPPPEYEIIAHATSSQAVAPATPAKIYPVQSMPQNIEGLFQNPEKVRLIKDMVARGCTDDEFEIFAHQSIIHGLDPLRGQIYVVKYGGAPAKIFTGRDGYLEIAHRSGVFDGMESGTRVDEKGDLVGWCKVFRKDMSHPFSIEVYYKEYSTGKNLWTSKPRVMIQKVAESSALRRAFSISGIYTPEEFGHESRQEAEGQ